jgi:hypothetical protein
MCRIMRLIDTRHAQEHRITAQELDDLVYDRLGVQSFVLGDLLGVRRRLRWLGHIRRMTHAHVQCPVHALELEQGTDPRVTRFKLRTASVSVGGLTPPRVAGGGGG